MTKGKQVRALEFVRKVRGGSQPILLRASDGHLYVAKFQNNSQGPNLLFNEALGTELFRLAGLKVPQWSFVEISDDFLDRNPSCWFQTNYGSRRPSSGMCFGSQFLSLRPHSLFEILPKRCFSRILNRKDFWTAWVLDVLCEHPDNRQGVFLDEHINRLTAYFIDHGHLFGGADGTATPRFLASRFLDSRIYSEPDRKDADHIQRTIHRLNWNALVDVARNLPDEWKTKAALARLEHFVDRASDPILLKMTVRFILNSYEPARKNYGGSPQSSRIAYRSQDLYAQISQA
jgi:hypothetical protein